MREMQALVRNYVLNRDRQMKYLAVLIALSLFVSFMVPFILMQPADSMAEASACGIEEHVHTEEAGCYQLFCAPEEGEEHVHSERCYALICEKIVHTHTPNCYPTKPDFSALFSTIYDPENLKATADGQSYANSPKDKPSEYKAPAGSILGVATHFHIFAESVSLQSHVHGNIATNWLLQNGAFGVYNDRLNGMSSINYIRNLGPNGNLDNAYQTQLIMGSDYSSPPSPWFSNRYEIRSKKDRKTYYIPKDKFPMWFAPEYVEPQVKFEKKDRPFINITQELNKFADMSMDLVEEAGAMDNDKGVSTKYPTVKSDPNGNFNGQSTTTPGTVVLQTQGENLTLDFSNIDDKYIYYTIDATNFDMVSPWSSWMKVLQIKGITEDKFLFLNIDVGTNPDAYFSKSWMVYKDDGTTYGTGEVPLEDGGCRVLYNIVSSDGNGGNYKPFEGKAVFGERRNGSILAPNADVNVAGNTNGTIIARNFVATGESHRCDIQQEGTEGDDADWSLGEETPTTPKQQKLEVTVKKNWSGGTSYNGVKVVLYKSKSPTLTDPHKVPGKEATLSSDNGWQTVFKDLPAYEAEEKLYYFVKEETEVSGFTATYENNMISVNSGTITITNVAKKKINVSVEKKWEHPSGSSTTDINVKLYQTTNANLDATKPEQFSGMTAIGDVWLNSGNNWKHTFSDLPELSDDGQKYYYYIVEQNVPANYAAGYTGNGVNTNSGTVTVTNSKDKMVSVTAKKEWKPTAPGSVVTVKVNLYQSTNGSLDATKASDFSSLTPLKTATLTAYNNWSYTFPEYPAMDASGNKYYYYIVEQDAPSGYTTIYTNNGITSDSGEVLITNVKDITVTAKKIWDPDTVASTPTTQETKTYKIMPIGDSITQGELGGADGSVGGGGAHGGYRKYLDYILEEKYEEFFGKDKTYNIDLVGPKNNVNPFDYNGAADEITATFSFNGTNVTYTYDNNHGGYSAHQSYTDDGNNSVYHQLVNADNNENSGSIKAAQPDIVLLMIGTNDRNALVDPDVYEQRLHTLLDYMLTELPKDSVVFVASIPEFDYYGYKDVTDYNNKVKRVVQSYANSGKNVRFVDVAAFIKLADLSDKIHPSESGYEKMGKNWATVIDSYIQELQPVSSVPAETREPINVRLYKSTNPYLDAEKQTDVDQMTYVQDATLNSDNGWTGKFEGLPAMENGSTLYYYIVEENVPKHYTVTYSNNAVNNNDGTVVVTNTKEKMLNITLDKEWVGGKPNNENITVTLYQSTERNLDMTVSDSDFQQLLNSNKLWKYSDEKNTGKSSVTFTAGETPHFTNLPVYNENGTMYYYYVRESNVSGYKPSYSKNPVYGADKEVTITNTKMISINVTKNWSINTGTVSSKQITVELYKYKHVPAEGEMSYWPSTFIPVGAELVETKTINANGGKVTFDNLPIEENGYKLFYYVKEADDAEITKNFDVIYGPEESGQLADPNQPDTYDKTITNKEKAATEISITVNKDWDVEDFFYDFDKDGTMDPPNDYYVQDSVNPVEQWADPIKVTLQYSTDGTNWTDYERYKDVEFYTTYTFTNLPKTTGANNTGSPYYYRVVESYNYGYVTEYKYPDGKSNINASEIQKGQAMPEVELKNTLLKRTLNVKKNWYNNINDGVDKVVVEIYRRTTNKKPDLGINPDGTISGGNGGNTGGDTPETFTPVEVLKTTFEDNDTTKDKWTVHGNTSSSQGQTTGIQNGQYHLCCGNSDSPSYISYTLNVVPGAKYSFSTQSSRSEITVLKVAYGNDAPEIVAQGDSTAANFTSAEVKGEFTVPEGVTSVTLQVGVTGQANYGADFDDITVTQLTAGTQVTPKPYINSFDNNTTEGWTQVGNHKNDTTQSGLQSSPTYDSSAYSYGLISQNGTANGAVSDLSGYYYCSYIQKEFTDLTAGSTYNFSTKVTRTTGDPVYVALRAVYNDGTPVEIARVQTTANKIDWKELAGDFTVPAGTTNVKLQIVPITNSGYMGTMMYVDDVKVELVSTGSNEPEPIFYNQFNDTNGWQPLQVQNGTVDVWTSGNAQYGGEGASLGVGGRTNGSTVYSGRVLASDGAYKPLDSSQFVPGNSYKFSAYARSGGGEDTFVLGLRYTLNGQTYRADIASKTIGGGWPDSPIESPAVQIPQGATNVQLCIYTKNNTDNFYIDEVKAFAATNGSQLNGYSEPTYNGGSQGGGNTGTDVTTVTYDFEDNSNQGWSGYNGGWANLTNWKKNGQYSLQIGNGSAAHDLSSSDFSTGYQYSFSAYVWGGNSSVNASLELHYEGATGSPIIIDSTSTLDGAELKGSATIPANATNVKLVVNGAGTQFMVDDITITGPYPSSNSKPRNVETFFSGSNTLTKRQLNVQKMEAVKLARASTACKDYWYDTEIVYSDNENQAPTLIEFDSFTRNGNTFVGDTVKHLEVQFYDRVSFPSEINVWLQGSGDFGGSNWKTSSDGLIHTFAKNILVKENTYLRVFTKKPELVKRLVLTFTNGTTLTINNTKSIADAARVESSAGTEAPTVSGTYSKDIAYLDGGDWANAWDIWNSGEELNQKWANQTINSADVYFAKDYGVDYTNLNTDNEAIKANQGSADVTKFGMYLLINGVINGSNRDWNGHEVYAALDSNSVTTGSDYVVANYTFTNSPQLSASSNNNISSLIIKTGDKLKVKAVVLKCNNGQSYVINNTEYSHVAGVTTDTRYYEFVQDFNYNSSSDGDSISQRWPNNDEKLDEIEVYFKKGVVNSSTLSSNLEFYNPGNVSGTFDVSDAVYDIARYSYTNNNVPKDQISQTINGKTGVPNAIKMIVLTSNWGSKFVIVNTAYAENNDYNTTADQFEKWYPFTQSDGVIDGVDRVNNVFLTIDDLGRDFYGKKIESLQMYINAKVTPGTTTPGGMGTNTFLQDYESGDTNGKLTCVGNIGTSKEKCQTVSGAYGMCNVFDYKIVDTYDGIADAAFHGANATDKWTGDRLNIQTKNPTDISRVVLTFDDGTTYTVWNMNYLGTEDGVLHYSHKTSFVENGATNLFADSELIDRYEGRKLDYIVVTYGEDGDEFLSIPRDLLNYDGNASNPSIGDISITHTFTNQIENPGVLKIIEDASDNFTLADIKEVKLFYKDSDTNVDGENSTYTIYNTDYSPKAEPDVPAIGNQPALGSDFVFITTLDLTKENNWQAALKGLPVTDGQGNAYEYVIVEKNVYGEGADRYQLVSYEHPDGVILEKDGTQTSFLNTTTDDENGLVIMPSSGGEGKTWFYVAGVALMLCGIAGCYGMKRRQRSRR
ncbi:MAG: Cna B-type domain-containing protein [Oscillospiraceae bacterium]|nr:Cna B-type domain-containing protein [Oscillospiraceae bacterium]